MYCILCVQIALLLDDENVSRGNRYLFASGCEVGSA